MSIRWQAAWAALLATASAFAQVPIEQTRFVYVGSLSDNQAIVTTGNYDFIARLYDSPQNGNQVAPEFAAPAMPVVAGQFSLELDFSYGILSPESWLELSLRPTGTATYETLSPRQRIDHVPMALYAQYGLNASHVPWSGITGIPSQLVDGTDADTLASLGCGASQIPVAGAAGTWSCADAPTNGLSILHGSGVPDAALGRVGEFYLDTTNTSLYGPKAAGGWGTPVSLIGPPGPGVGSTPPDAPIGTMTLEPQLVGTAPTVLSLRQLSVGIRNTSADASGTVALNYVSVVVAASDVLPLLFQKAVTGAAFSRSRIDLVVTGIETNALVDVQALKLAGLRSIPSNDPAGEPRIALDFSVSGTIAVNSETQSAYYDTASSTGSVPLSLCTPLFSSFAQGTPPADFTGQTTAGANVLSVSRPTTGAATFANPLLSFELRGSNPEAARNLAICGFGLIAAKSHFNSSWSYYAPGAASINDWLERLAWTEAAGTYFTLSASTPDNLSANFELYPIMRIRVSTPAYSFCWNRQTASSC